MLTFPMPVAMINLFIVSILGTDSFREGGHDATCSSSGGRAGDLAVLHPCPPSLGQETGKAAPASACCSIVQLCMTEGAHRIEA